MSRLTAVLLAAGLGSATVIAQAATTIASVSPQGEVAQVRQVTVKFSEAVVPLGDCAARPVPSAAGAGARRIGSLATTGSGSTTSARRCRRACDARQSPAGVEAHRRGERTPLRSH